MVKEKEKAPPDLRYSIAAQCRSLLADTWQRVPSRESRVIEILRERMGVPDSIGGDYVPSSALWSRSTLTTLTPPAAGYLVGTELSSYLPALKAASITLQLGATTVMLERGSANVPVGVNAVQTYWASDETTPLAESNASFTVLPLTRHNLFGYCEISRQLLLQSVADEIVPYELTRSLGAELDRQVLGGTGTGGTPLGIFGYPGVGTFTGASLNYAALVAAMAEVSNANAVLDPDRLGWAATPNVAALLKQRYRASGGELPLWAGQIAAGSIEEARAFASTNVPPSSAVFGDWSQLLIAQWPDGLSIAIDPFTKFQIGVVGIRACISIDVQLRTPSAFAIATGVT